MNRKSKAKILLGTFIVSGALSQMSSISPLYAMVNDDDDATITSGAATAAAATAATSESDTFPLHAAAEKGDLNEFQHIISDIPIKDRNKMINTQDINGNTVLHRAVLSLNFSNGLDDRIVSYILKNYGC